MPNALYFRKSSHSACAERIPLIFRGKTSAAFPDGSSTTYWFFFVNQTDSVLNFARGQTPADDTCVYWNVYWNTVFCEKFRATFLSLSEEKKATSAGLKRLRRSRRPLAYSLRNCPKNGSVRLLFHQNNGNEAAKNAKPDETSPPTFDKDYFAL